MAGLVVCLAACVAYASTIPGYFLNDDFGVVALLATKPATYFPRWFVTSWMDTIWGFYPDEIRPFPAVSYQLTALAGSGSPIGHHLLNVAIHAVNGLLVLALARIAIGMPVWPAALAALVFVLLPVQTESVAWITGRVDSLPALFYLGSVTAWVLWRRRGEPARIYAMSLALGFMAVFSKQNTITLVPALLLHDVIVERRWPRPSWTWLWPYLPFTLITLGYLYLRLVLFGEVARESSLTAEGMNYALGVIERHGWRVIFGHASAPSAFELWTFLVLIAIVAACAVRVPRRLEGRNSSQIFSAGLQDVSPRRSPGSPTRVVQRVGVGRRGKTNAVPARLGAGTYFVIVWWVLGVVPVLVAGYESARHVYLASVAWAMLVGLAFEWTWTAARTQTMRVVVMLVTVAIFGRYTMELSTSIADWNGRSRLSQRAAQDLEREALAAPQGALLIVGAPSSVWEWALPFVARPPFARADLTTRVHIVSPRLLHCCRGQWETDTRRTIEAWRERRDASPVIALRWNERTGALLRVTDREAPDLRSLAAYLAEIPSGDDMDRVMTEALQRLVVR